MIVANRKKGTNVLAYKTGGMTLRVAIKGGEQIDIPELTDKNQIVNYADFVNRGWFELLEKTSSEKVETTETTVESALERAKKEVVEYSKEEEKKDKKQSNKQ
jgi:hypothetical protein